jgi:hypothetical protein
VVVVVGEGEVEGEEGGLCWYNRNVDEVMRKEMEVE